MPGSYVDNAMNRRLGRVGMPRGSMPESKSGSGGSGGYYVDNSMNRGLGRVGMPHGSMPHSRNGSGSSSSGSLASLLSFNAATVGSSSYITSSFGNTYADNDYNRRVGRAGLPKGSMPISKYDNSFTGNTLNTTRNTSSYANEPDSYADNVFNRRHEGSYTTRRSDHIRSSERDTEVKKTYADNSFNRQAGRVGLPVGSKVVSKYSDSANQNVSSFGSERKPPVGDNVYADNSFNRRVGRVGLPIGTRVMSKTQDPPKVTTGAMKIHASSDKDPLSDSSSAERRQSAPAKPADSCTASTKTYVNNALNTRLGRVGLPLGSAKLTKSSTPKQYVDNPANHLLDRVGKQVGEAVHSRKTHYVRRENYVDNCLNRQLGRVGLPRGSRPVTWKSSTTKQLSKMVELLANVNRQDDDHDYRLSDNDYRLSDNDIYGLDSSDDVCERIGAYEVAKCQCNRKYEELAWMKSHQSFESPKTSTSVLEIDTGVIISFAALSLGTKIGQGRFGEVFYGEWRESVVAVKKLRSRNFSKRTLKAFEREMVMLCQLDHPTIIKLIGVCVEMPDICIVMEYMGMSLFDALHIRNDFDLSESKRLDIICQICDGLYYLHSKGIAHCNLKTANVLLKYADDGEELAIKVTDFGMSMMKDKVQRTTNEKMMAHADTVRYTAPEVLRGDMLKVEEMMMADVYSLALVLFEVIYEAEAYYDLSYIQILKLVGETGITPAVPELPHVARGVKSIMQKAWGFSPIHRPTALEVLHRCSSRDQLYFERASEQ